MSTAAQNFTNAMEYDDASIEIEFQMPPVNSAWVKTLVAYGLAHPEDEAALLENRTPSPTPTETIPDVLPSGEDTSSSEDGEEEDLDALLDFLGPALSDTDMDDIFVGNMMNKTTLKRKPTEDLDEMVQKKPRII